MPVQIIYMYVLQKPGIVEHLEIVSFMSSNKSFQYRLECIHTVSVFGYLIQLNCSHNLDFVQFLLTVTEFECAGAD